MSWPFEDLTGRTYGRLFVISCHGVMPSKKRMWDCRCSCGKQVVVQGGNIKSGHTKSCGCLNQEMKYARSTHGHSKGRKVTRTFRSWCSMKMRCLDVNAPCYKDYGGRGINICKRWLDSFDNFLADMGERPRGTSLGRINNDGNYKPSNCRWETPSEQANNTRSSRRVAVGDKTLTVAQWARAIGVKPRLLYGRLNRRVPIEKFLNV